MNNWKLVGTIIAAVLVVGFLMYKTKWNNKNITSEDNYSQDYLMYEQLEERKDQEQDHLLNQVVSQISANSENEIESCYRATENLREKILDKHLKASDLVKKKYLVPKGLNYDNKECDAPPKHILKLMDTETTQPHSKIENNPTFTNLPNFFGDNGLRPNTMPCPDSWKQRSD